MAKLSKQQTTILIVVLSVAVLFGVKTFIDSSRGELGKGKLARADGSRNAPVKVIEYIDFQCPACAKGSKMLHNIMDANPGQIYLELKYFPLGGHRHGFTSARYAECAAQQDRFWPFTKLVIERQDQWKRKLDARPNFRAMAKEVNLDIDKLNACLSDEKINETILEDKNKGISLGIKSTPTYFINGKMTVGSKSLISELKKHMEIDESLLEVNGHAHHNH